MIAEIQGEEKLTSNELLDLNKKKIDLIAVKLQQEGGLNLQAWNKVMNEKPILPNIDIQREAFRMYQKLWIPMTLLFSKKPLRNYSKYFL